MGKATTASGREFYAATTPTPSNPYLASFDEYLWVNFREWPWVAGSLCVLNKSVVLRAENSYNVFHVYQIYHYYLSST